MARVALRRGGGNLAEFFSIVANAFDTKLLGIEQITGVTVTRDAATKVYNIEVAHTLDSQAWQTFIDTYGPPEDASDSTPAPVVYEDGAQDTADGPPSDQTGIGIIIYHGTDGTDRKVLYALAYVTDDSGSYSTENNVEARPTLKFRTYAAPAATTIAAAKFAATKVTFAAGTKTIALGSKGKVDYMPKQT